MMHISKKLDSRETAGKDYFGDGTVLYLESPDVVELHSEQACKVGANNASMHENSYNPFRTFTGYSIDFP